MFVSGCANKTEEPTIENKRVTVKDESNGYKSIRFTFEVDGNEYEAYITGLTLGKNNTDEEYDKMINDLAIEMAKDSRFIVSDDPEFVEKYGLEIKPIDAEKTSIYFSDHTNLCWAASDSDILEYTGWAKLVKDKNFNSEDDIFDYYTESFSDYTGRQRIGLKWFFNGVNEYQGMAYLGNQLTPFTSGLLSEYAAENFVHSVNIPEVDYVEAGKIMMEQLDNGSGIGTIIYAYNLTSNEELEEGVFDMAHAITTFGYIKDLKTGELKAVFNADSDNDASKITDEEEYNKVEDGKHTDGQVADKNLRVNKLTMFPVSKFEPNSYLLDSGEYIEYIDGYAPENGEFAYSYETYKMGNYYKNNDGIASIMSFEYLEECSEENLANKEVNGSKNAMHDIDFVISNCCITDEDYNIIDSISKDDNFICCISLENHSYVNTDGNCLLNYRIVANDGKQDIVLYQDKIYCNYELTRYLGSGYLEDVIKLNTSGTYDIRVEIVDLSDESGALINEAYYSNNISNPVRLVVEN